MYNSFHTALSRGSGRIEDACGESPAASLLWLRSLGEVQIIRSLFVHHSFIIRSYSCIMQTKPSKRHVTVPRGDFWVSWEHLGAIVPLDKHPQHSKAIPKPSKFSPQESKERKTTKKHPKVCSKENTSVFDYFWTSQDSGKV